MQTHMLVFGSRERATQRSKTMRSTADSKGVCTSLEVGVVSWRTTKSMATHWPECRSERGVTLSLGIMRFTTDYMEASMW